MCVYTKENISIAKTLSYKKEGLKLKSQNLISVARAVEIFVQKEV